MNLVISSLIERFFKARAVRAGIIKGLGLALKINTKKCNLSQQNKAKKRQELALGLPPADSCIMYVIF